MKRFAAGLVVVLLLFYLVAVSVSGGGHWIVAIALELLLMAATWFLTRFNTDTVGTGAMVVGMFLAPNFAPPFGFSHASMSDAFFFLGLVLLFPRLVRGRLQLPATWGVGILIFLSMSLATFILSTYSGTSIVRLVAVLITLVFFPLAIMWWHPPLKLVNRLCTAYVAGQCFSTIVPFLTGSGSSSRLEGLTTQPNAFGTCGVLATGMLVHLLSQPITQRRRRWLYLALAICVAGIVMSGSRAALIALIVIVIAIPFVERTGATYTRYALGGALMLLLVPVLLGHLGSESAPSRLLHPDQSVGASGSNDQRNALLSEGFSEFVHHPIFGGGYGGTLTFYYHDVFLEVGVATGLIGLFGYLLVIGATVRPMFSKHPLHLLGYASLGYVVTSVFSPTITERWIWAPLTLALLGNLTRTSAETHPPARTGAPIETPSASPEPTDRTTPPTSPEEAAPAWSA